MFGMKHFLNGILKKQEIKTQIKTYLSVFRTAASCHAEDSQHYISPKKQKVLKVAIIGCPNAGKSTLINQLIQRSIFAVSKKVHTTRYKARGVLVDGDTQLIFLDTPGLVSLEESQKYNLASYFVNGGENAISEADAIGVIHDVSIKQTRHRLDPKVIRLLHIYKDKESFLILNKIDTIKPKRTLLNLSDTLTGGTLRKYSEKLDDKPLTELQIKEKIQSEPHWRHFSDVFMISALLGQGTEDLRNYLLNSAHPGEWIYAEETYTDQSPVKRVEEAVRSKLLEYLPQEVPYILKVELEYLDMESSDTIVAVVLIGCKSEKLQRMVKGFKGERIKIIATEAEQELTDFFLRPVHLNVVISRKCENEIYEE